jgi:hypothetical protein
MKKSRKPKFHTFPNNKWDQGVYYNKQINRIRNALR